MNTYTVVQRNYNSWVRTDAGDIYEIVRDCGHKHKSLDAAIKCKASYGNSELGYFGKIENQDGVSAGEERAANDTYAGFSDEVRERILLG
ncbi:unnamed protein product [Sphagnum tenellum]